MNYPSFGFRILLSALALSLLGACSESRPTAEVANEIQSPPRAAAKPSPSSAGSRSDYEDLDWTDLIPEDDLQALLNPPDYLDEIVDGSEDDTLESELRATSINPDDPYQRALVSTRVKSEYHQRRVRIPGFVVPLDFDDDMVITRFFLVPFFGACIHVPPPPPNQILYATYEPGLRADALYDPFYVEGTLFTELIENSMATAAYSLVADRIYLYDD